MNWWQTIKFAGKTLYHGTSIDNVPSIQQYGLVPTVGNLVSDAYEAEYKAVGVDLPDLTFAGDKQGLMSCVSAMVTAVEQYIGRSPTSNDIARYGALAVFQDDMVGGPPIPSAWDHRPRDNYDSEEWGASHQDSYPQVEPGDYYRENRIKPTYILTGKKMVNFLSSHGEWPPLSTQDDSSETYLRQQLLNMGVNITLKKNPNLTRQQAYQSALEKVQPLNHSELQNYLWFGSPQKLF